MRIAIDAGHGGIDPGVTSEDNTYEKDISLKLALMLEDDLRGKELDLDLLNLRLDDDTIFLEERVNKINTFKADFFISIHTNLSFSKSSQGIQTYCYLFGLEDEKLARTIHEEMIWETGRPDRGVKEGDLFLLRETKIPGCQVEVCFINNQEEHLLLLDDIFLSKVVNAMARGIIKYLSQKELNTEATIM